MINRFYSGYIGSFKGLRKEVWWLALVTLINRAGSMVVPFLSLYLSSDLGFNLKNVGWVMSVFGLGSVVGAWLGGKLTDKWGFYPVIFWSLFLSGIMFIGLQFIHSFAGFCMGIFFLMIVADAYRPAVYVAINTYSRPENRTRSVTLIRLAINLGFSAGPAAGGLIITLVSYTGLFWADGLTCMAAAVLFINVLDKWQTRKDTDQVQKTGNISPYRDVPYLLFLLIVLLTGAAFLQYFSTMPLYYRNIHSLSEDAIGFLMAINGMLIFLIEMPLIKFFESRLSRYTILIISTSLFAFSFLLLNLTPWNGILVTGMCIMTFGEMLNFPFLNRFALDRSEHGKSGDYMALFTMAFSVAHIIGHNSGMHLVDRYGYRITWYIMIGVLLTAALLIIWLRQILQKEGVGQKI